MCVTLNLCVRVVHHGYMYSNTLSSHMHCVFLVIVSVRVQASHMSRASYSDDGGVEKVHSYMSMQCIFHPTEQYIIIFIVTLVQCLCLSANRTKWN